MIIILHYITKNHQREKDKEEIDIHRPIQILVPATTLTSMTDHKECFF